MMRLLTLLFIVLFVGSAAPASSASASRLLMVVVMSRHGVRSPSHPLELQAYAAQPWPSWSGLHGGYLTERGAVLMRQFGAYYRRLYGPMLGMAASGCPSAGSVFIWADVDERTKATGSSIAQGFAPGCNIAVGHAPSDPDTLFDPLPSLGTVNKAESNASVLGSVGGSFSGITQAYGAAFAAMENVLGCTASSKCKELSSVASYITNDGDGGLASLNGGLDMAGDVSENLLLEYTDGQSVVGWGRVNHVTLLQLLQFEVLGKEIEHNRFAARAHSSNIMAHILQTLQEGATGKSVEGTRVPAQAKFVFLSGHDTQLAEFRSLLGLSWAVKGDQRNNTTPGSALIFEVHQPAGGGDPFVRTFYAVQSLDAMRAGHGEEPLRVPVYVPGCPGFDCPIGTFSEIVTAAIDPKFVSAWR
jgi:4-phytase / acid phosphatase